MAMYVRATLALVSALVFSRAAFADAVYLAELSLNAVAVSDGELVKQPVTNDLLINLALGTGPTSAIPVNLTLAVVLDCVTGDVALVVFNVSNDVVVATIADSDEEDLLPTAKATALGALLDVNPVGDLTTADMDPRNGIFGGYLVLTGRYKPIVESEPFFNGCPAGARASLLGAIDIVFTDDAGEQTPTGVVLKGSIKLGKEPIAQVN